MRRVGRMSALQKRYLSQPHKYWLRLAADFPLPESFVEGIPNWEEVFQSAAPLALDLGFGMGDGTIKLARHFSGYNWLAIDVHTPGIGKLLHMIDCHAMHNIRVLEGDVWQWMKYIPVHSLHLVKILFPDPWPKKRHHKRRLINQEFLDKLSVKMARGGILDIATDDEGYAQSINALLNYSCLWSKLADDGNMNMEDIKGTVSLPDDYTSFWPQTKFYLRTIKEKRKVYFHAFYKN